MTAYCWVGFGMWSRVAVTVPDGMSNSQRRQVREFAGRRSVGGPEGRGCNRRIRRCTIGIPAR